MPDFKAPDGDQQQAAARITLGLLYAVEEESAVTQRRLASELGIAVGLVNAYLKRCVNKGLIKVQQVPRRRYAYFLTPKGFAEKSRLAASYLAYSFDFFRKARASCDTAMERAVAAGWERLILVGQSDLAEIAVVCALNHPLRIVAVVDGEAERGARFAGIPLAGAIADVAEPFDGALITTIADTQGAWDGATAALGADRVLVPNVLAQAISAERKSGAE
ncbi:MAG TPA: winged helix-turn-helix transcriptional regulator [Hyphomicrobiales bacterium]|nr:winged helix-turn-helix transcriptional regulator [Rhodobiaceae bacterium]HXK53692.1 winged helix-turn-helix transcriptional regulator [Hyphomicrobiales bacterium]